MFNIPNTITFLRIIFSFSLFLVSPLSGLFYAIYIFCGISDVLDGFIARKFHMQTEFGAKLDSISDVLFLAIVAIRVVPTLKIKTQFFIWAFVIIAIKVINLIIVALKFGTFGMLHTYLIKGVGVALFVSPLLLKPLGTDFVLLALCILTTLSAVEELIILLMYKDLNLNRKWIFDKGKLA